MACCHAPFNYHEATMLAYNPDFRHAWADVWCAQVTPMDRAGCFNFGLGNSHNRGMALNSRIAIVEVNQNIRAAWVEAMNMFISVKSIILLKAPTNRFLPHLRLLNLLPRRDGSQNR
jgi:acyl-CoA hydrolase